MPRLSTARCCLARARRDLISSADTIIDIAKSCHTLVSLIGDIQVRRRRLRGQRDAHAAGGRGRRARGGEAPGGSGAWGTAGPAEDRRLEPPQGPAPCTLRLRHTSAGGGCRRRMVWASCRAASWSASTARRTSTPTPPMTASTVRLLACLLVGVYSLILSMGHAHTDPRDGPLGRLLGRP